MQASDGHTYERSAIEAWLQTSQVSPVTNEPLKSLEVIPSHTLRTMLATYNNSNAVLPGDSDADGSATDRPAAELTIIQSSHNHT